MQFYESSRDAHRHPVCWESDNLYCYPHFHKSIELVYVFEGKVQGNLNGHVFEAVSGQLLIVPGYTIHNFQMSDETKAWLCTIPLDVVASYRQVLSRQTFSRFVIDVMPEQSILLEYFRQIRCCVEEKNSLSGQAMMTGYAYLILGYLIEHAGLEPIKSAKMASFAQEVLGYLEEHYLESCDLEEISRHFGYSRSRFSHIFNENFGCRLVEYVNGLRCAYAMELMKDGKKTITDIALESGFETTRTFYRAFRKYYGATPGEVAAEMLLKTEIS